MYIKEAHLEGMKSGQVKAVMVLFSMSSGISYHLLSATILFTIAVLKYANPASIGMD